MPHRLLMNGHLKSDMSKKPANRPMCLLPVMEKMEAGIGVATLEVPNYMRRQRCFPRTWFACEPIEYWRFTR